MWFTNKTRVFAIFLIAASQYVCKADLTNEQRYSFGDMFAATGAQLDAREAYWKAQGMPASVDCCLDWDDSYDGENFPHPVGSVTNREYFQQEMLTKDKAEWEKQLGWWLQGRLTMSQTEALVAEKEKKMADFDKKFPEWRLFVFDGYDMRTSEQKKNGVEFIKLNGAPSDYIYDMRHAGGRIDNVLWNARDLIPIRHHHNVEHLFHSDKEKLVLHTA